MRCHAVVPSMSLDDLEKIAAGEEPQQSREHERLEHRVVPMEHSIEARQAALKLERELLTELVNGFIESPLEVQLYIFKATPLQKLQRMKASEAKSAKVGVGPSRQQDTDEEADSDAE